VGITLPIEILPFKTNYQACVFRRFRLAIDPTMLTAMFLSSKHISQFLTYFLPSPFSNLLYSFKVLQSPALKV